MNCILFFPDEISDEGLAAVEGVRAKRLIREHDLKSGLTLRAGVLGGKLGTATLTVCTQDRLEASLSLEDSPPPRLNLSLIVAVPRPQTVKMIIQLAAATGIGRLDFVRTEKVVPSYLQSKSLIPEAIETEVLKGLQQACDTISPKIAVHENFKSYLGKLNFLQGALSLIADNQFGDKARSTVQTPSSIHPTHIILAIGPESGWTKQEYDQLVERSFKPISLGKRMYRSEQALALLIGQLISSFGLLKEQK